MATTTLSSQYREPTTPAMKNNPNNYGNAPRLSWEPNTAEGTANLLAQDVSGATKGEYKTETFPVDGIEPAAHTELLSPLPAPSQDAFKVQRQPVTGSHQNRNSKKSPAPGLFLFWDGLQPYKYIGNSYSGRFHWRTCPFGKAESAHHIVLFSYRKQAIEAGFSPCRYCLPPDWKVVRAKLLAPAQDSTHIPDAGQR